MSPLAQAESKIFWTKTNHQKIHGIKSTMVSANLKYYGGPVLSNPKVFAVFWGSSVDANIQKNMGDFYSTMLSNPYMDWLKEYNTTNLSGQDGLAGSNQTIGRGTLGGSVVLNPSNTSTTLADVDVQNEIEAQIASGKLTASDANTLYMVSFPPGVSITLSEGGGTYTSCVDFCAYHNSFADKSGKQIFYGVMPDFSGACGNACGTNDAFGNYTSAASHEVIEATTDSNVSQMGSGIARPLAWYDTSNGEIGDICAYQGFDGTVKSSASGNTYVIQGQWSNAQNACVVKPAGQL